ncbi:8788_t:CDS:2 [Racocetra fulgida]|uniref:8788_t:CDS:1 n=1 Tax=Racocetra fulgida TaxID=60492 RepID=A0A9N9C0S3_9GLOM|nr:8788_t:CDS:2 [Racocetra fulgida]
MRYLVNGKEYFFDRNGEMFYYILEFYRTGKLLCPIGSYIKLEKELSYFQIPFDKSELALEASTKAVDRFILCLKKLIISYCENFHDNIILYIAKSGVSMRTKNFCPLLFSDNLIERCTYQILVKLEKQIGEHLVKTFSELELMWNCEPNYSGFLITITFSIKKLFQFKNTQNSVSSLILDNISEEKIILNVGGKKYETFRSILTAQPKTLLGVMFQDRNNCMRHPVNGNEYFFDRNSEIFAYIMEFYQTGKIPWFIFDTTKIIYKQLEEELDYFQIPINKSTIFCSLALEGAASTFKQFILAFEELIIQHCENFRSEISLTIRPGSILVDDRESSLSIERFKMNAYNILIEKEKQIGYHLSKTFCKLGLEWKFEKSERKHYGIEQLLEIFISFSIRIG